MNYIGEFTSLMSLEVQNEFAMQKLANQIIEITGFKSGIIFLPLSVNDHAPRKCDIFLQWKTRCAELEFSLGKV